MKIAVVKIGARIYTPLTGHKNGNTGENKLIVNLFLKNNHQVDLVTLPGKKDLPGVFFESENVKINDIREAYKDINSHNYDILVVINGTANFFGGKDMYNICETYKIINEFNGKILFFFTDPVCALKQIWHDSFPKSRNAKWNTTWTKEELLITRKDIVMVSAASTVDLNKRPFTSKPVYTDYSKIVHFEFQKAAFFDKLNSETYLSEKTSDLVYGGFYREGVRHKQMLEYFHDTEYTAKFFGKIAKYRFEKENINTFPEYKEQLGGWDFFREETNRSLCTLIFAEEYYCDNIVTMRVFASVQAKVVVFIENSYDSSHNVFKDSEFNGFNYINSKKELTEKINIVKSWSQQDYDNYIQKQINALTISSDEFYKSFNTLL